MVYDEGLAHRIRELLDDRPDLVEKKLLGGIAFMLQGNLCCGIHREDLIVRVGRDGYAAAVARPHARPFDITGRPMTGWVMVSPDGYESDDALQVWVQQGVQFPLSLPAK